MNIFVIGNGFDLAHGLPTKYTDFLNFLRKINSVEVNTPLWFFQPFEQMNAYKNLVPHLQKLSDNNPWYYYFCEKTLLNSNWCDFENEIEYVVKQLEKAKKYLDESRKMSLSDCQGLKVEVEFLTHAIPHYIGKNGRTKKISVAYNSIFLSLNSDDDFSGLPDCFLTINFEKLVKFILDELGELTKCFELYLHGFVDFLTIERIKLISRLFDMPDNSQTKIINFNYTNTVMKYLNKEIDEDAICFIHGCACTDDNSNLVLGIDERDGSSVDPLFVLFRKYFQRVSKSCDKKYRKWINLIEDENQKALYQIGYTDNPKHYLVIIGHSLTMSDRKVLNELINLDNMKTVIFFHDKANEINLMKNLAAILGYEVFSELMETDVIRFKQGDFCSKET